MDKEALKQYMRERVLSLDPSADVEDGSAYDSEVFSPILDYLGDSPYDAGIVEFIRARLRGYDPVGGEVDEADALMDLAVKPLAHVLDPLVMELNRLRNHQALTRPDLHTRESASALGSNWFVEMDDGDYTTGIVRLYFRAPISAVVNTTNQLFTIGGEIFLPIQRQTITQVEMLSNVQGSQYYWDIFVRAQETGRIPVAKGDVISISGLDAAVRVTNLNAFEQGRRRETVEGFLERVGESIGERSLVTSRGAFAHIRELFPAARSVEVAGYNDLEMGRDAVSYIMSGTRAQAISSPISFPLTLFAGVSDRIAVNVDDGAGGWSTPLTLDIAGTYNHIGALVAAINNAWYGAGGTGCIATAWGSNRLLLHSSSNVPNTSLGFEASKLLLSEVATRSAWASLGYAGVILGVPLTGTGGLLLSSMPGGILRPNTAYGQYSPTKEKTFHLGGVTDVYIQPSSHNEQTMLTTGSTSARPTWTGCELRTNPTFVASDVVQDMASVASNARPSRADFTQPLAVAGYDILSPLQDATSAFEADVLLGAKVEQGDVLTVFSGTAAGTYRVAATPSEDPSLSGTNALRVDRVLPPIVESHLNYQITSSFRLRLTSPSTRNKITSVHGTGLHMTGAADFAWWHAPPSVVLSSVTFSRWGVEAGDTLEVLRRTNGGASENAGLYTIVRVTANSIVLDRPARETETVSFKVYRALQDSVSRPFMRIKEVALLSDDGSQTGEVLPYALPVLVQSRGLSGARVLASGSNGFVSSSTPNDFSVPTSAVDFVSRGVKIGDVLTLRHASVFGTELGEPVQRRVSLVFDHHISFDSPLPIATGNFASDVVYEVGPPSTGTARFYFQEPVSFEIQQERVRVRHTPTGPLYYSSPHVLTLRNDSADVRDDGTRYVAEWRGFEDAMQVYPPPLFANTRSYLHFAQDVRTMYDNAPATAVSLSFSEMVCRELGLKTHDTSSWSMGDALLILAERMVGIGKTDTFVDAVTAAQDEMHRRLFSLLRVEPDGTINASIVPDAFNSIFTFASYGLTDAGPDVTNTVEGAFGRLIGNVVSLHGEDDQSQGNTGRYLINSLPLLHSDPSRRHRTMALTPIVEEGVSQIESGQEKVMPHTPLYAGCGRTRYDQTIIQLSAGAGDYLVGETVVNGSLSLTVSRWDSATSRLYVWGREDHALPLSGTWIGQQSGVGRSHVSYAPTLSIMPMDGTSKLTFTGGGVAPGWYSPSERGGWIAGACLYLYGIHNTTPTTNQYQGALNAMGMWRIVETNSTGTEVTVEHIADDSLLFDNEGAGNTIEMGWLLSIPDTQDPYLADRFTVYDDAPRVFPLHEIQYEVGGVTVDGRLKIYDSDGLFYSRLQGRLWGGYKNPYRIVRPGRSRIEARQMERQREDGLYYFDVPVHSSGCALTHNIEQDTPMLLHTPACPLRGAWRGVHKEYVGEGYVLHTKDPYLSYSRTEQVDLVACPAITTVQQGDNLGRKVLVETRPLSLRYEWSPLVADVDAVIQSESERVICASLMARSFMPIFVRLSIQYAGDVDELQLERDVEEYIATLTGSDRLEVSDLEALLHKRGVDFIDQNFAVVALMWDQRRQVIAARSRNYIGGDETSVSRRWASHRTSHFTPDVIAVTRL